MSSNVNIMEKHKKASEQLLMRDDILQFSFDVVASARNQRRYRSNRNNMQGVSMQVPLEFQQQVKSNNAVSQPAQKPGKNGQIFSSAYEKINQYFTQYEKVKRASFTTRNTNNRYKQGNASDPKMSKSQSVNLPMKKKLNKVTSFNNEKTQQSPLYNIATPQTSKQNSFLFNSSRTQMPNTFRQIQKKHSKREMKDDYMQNWLNEVLIEVSPNLQIDRNDENGGLKAYQIDRSSLLTIGIHPSNINRLYRSFFVYSIGFNNLLKQLCNKNQKLQNSIWRVFALLLQYCSEGNFDTMIGQIQRDKQNKLLILKKQIQERQKLIQKSDEFHENKNAKIVRQLRELQDKTKDLQQQREALLQQFHQTQQAFNEQIALRLKYEVKINQVHGLHEQVVQKYRLVKQDYFKHKDICQTQKQTITNLRSQLADMRNQLQQKMRKIKDHEFYIKQLLLTVEKKQNNLNSANENLLQAKTKIEGLNSDIEVKNREIDQLNLRLQNMLSSQKCSTSILRSKGEQFEKAMKQNAQLHQHIHKNLIDINRMAQQKRQLGHKTTQISALMAIQSKKLHQKQQQVKHAKRLIDELGEQVNNNGVGHAAEFERAQSLQQDIQAYIENIQKMKEKQNEIYSLLDYANQHIASLQQIIQSKKNNEQKYVIQIQNLKMKLTQVKSQIQEKQKRALKAEDEFKSANDVWRLKLFQLDEELEKARQKYYKAEKQRDQYRQQIQAYKQKYEKIYLQYKDEKFERNNLDLYYKQSLAVMQQEIEHIKRQSIQISQMSQVIQQWKRKYNALKLINNHKIQIFQNDTKMWRQKYQQLSHKSNERESYIHPFIHQDVCSHYLRLQQQLKKAAQTLKKYKSQITTLEGQKFSLVQEIKSKDKKPKNDSQKQYVIDIEKKDKQILFLKQKLQYLSNKLNESQESMFKAYKEKSSAIQMVRNAQTQFMNKINQRNEALKQLNEKYRKLLQLNEDQLKQNQNLASKIDKSNKQIKIKVDEVLPHKWQGAERSLSPQNKQKKNTSKMDHLQIMKPIRAHEDRLKSQNITQKSHTKMNEIDDKLSSNELKDIEIDEQPLHSHHLGEQPIENPNEKREYMKKKIKGAYLYYIK